MFPFCACTLYQSLELVKFVEKHYNGKITQTLFDKLDQHKPVNGNSQSRKEDILAFMKEVNPNLQIRGMNKTKPVTNKSNNNNIVTPTPVSVIAQQPALSVSNHGHMRPQASLELSTGSTHAHVLSPTPVTVVSPVQVALSPVVISKPQPVQPRVMILKPLTHSAQSTLVSNNSNVNTKDSNIHHNINSSTSCNSSGQLALPHGWEVKRDQHGLFFVDHIHRKTTRDDPRPLPKGWRMGKDTNGRKFYICDELSFSYCRCCCIVFCPFFLPFFILY